MLPSWHHLWHPSQAYIALMQMLNQSFITITQIQRPMLYSNYSENTSILMHSHAMK
jgi:hypothetical protein